jgi:hypothetical protein
MICGVKFHWKRVVVVFMITAWLWVGIAYAVLEVAARLFHYHFYY